MNSATHYANMTASKYTHVGIAVARSAAGRLYGVQVFARYTTKAALYTAAEVKTAQQKVRDGITTVRTAAGKKTLVTSAKMTAQAQAWANRMALATGLLAKPSYTSGWTTGYTASTQIVANASGTNRTTALDALKAKAGTALTAGYTHVGVGVARARDGKIYVVAMLAKYPSSVTVG